jgi:hypothetical protein
MIANLEPYETENGSTHDPNKVYTKQCNHVAWLDFETSFDTNLFAQV